MPAGVAGAAVAVSEMRRKKQLNDAGHVLWEDTPGMARGRAIMADRKLPREVLRLRGVTTAVKGYDEDYVPKRKPAKERQLRTPLQRAIMGREE